MSVLNYFGGKSVIAPWILQHFPAHSHYWDLFGGGGSVLLAKNPSETEAYCDVYEPVINFFRCLKLEPSALVGQVEHLIFVASLGDRVHCDFLLQDPSNLQGYSVLNAAQFYIYSKLSFSGAGTRWSTGKSPSTEIEDIDTLCLWEASNRLKNVDIWQLSCFDVLSNIPKSSDCFIYADPPYVMAARKSKDNRHKDKQKSMARRQYAHEFTDEDHCRLIAALDGHSALVSGFDSELYQAIIPADWRSVSKRVGSELEMLWISPQAWEQIPQRSLFDLLEVTA